MNLLNIILLLILTLYQIKFLAAESVDGTSPFSGGNKIRYSGNEFFWIITFSTGLLSLASGGLGVDFSAIRLFILITFMVWIIIRNIGEIKLTFPLVIYLIYLLWLIIGLTYSSAPSYGFRVFLKYTYPLTIAVAASIIVRYKEVFFKSAIYARRLALVSFLITFIPFIEDFFAGIICYGTARAINFIAMGMFSMALLIHNKAEKKRNVFYVLVFVIPCILWVFRTSIYGTFLAFASFFIIKDHVKAIPKILLLGIAGLAIILGIPSVREKMFKEEANVDTYEDVRNIRRTDIRDNNRETMWTDVSNKLYKPHKVKGSGTGSTQHFFYEVYKGGRIGGQVHNDFLQILADNGLIGLILYLSTTFSIFLHCFIMYRTTKDTSVKICVLTAGASIIGVTSTMFSDNTVSYSMATLAFPWGFYGMALGLNRMKNKKTKIITD